MDKHNKPLYLQLVEKIKNMLVRGELPAGSKVAPVRELAKMHGVNPNTMQRALAELEREGYLHSMRTAGRIVTTDKQALTRLRAEERYNSTCRYIAQMEELGVPRKEIPALLTEVLRIEEQSESMDNIPKIP